MTKSLHSTISQLFKSEFSELEILIVRHCQLEQAKTTKLNAVHQARGYDLREIVLHFGDLSSFQCKLEFMHIFQNKLT